MTTAELHSYAYQRIADHTERLGAARRRAARRRMALRFLFGHCAWTGPRLHAALGCLASRALD